MKPTIPKGTRDFSPRDVHRRDFIFNTIRAIFIKYGYQPIETPVMENLATLTGKYGEEGDKLLFKVLNNGDYLAKADAQALEQRDSRGLLPSISRRGLRYDLTVPFARYVVMHRNELTFPFKRFQIQPVWRADRPQKGRYQEFYQCDADAIGSRSLSLEAEYVLMIDEVFQGLGLEVEIMINHRKVLGGIAEKAGVADKMMQMTMAVDKLDKIGWEGVIRDLQSRDFTAEQCGVIQSLFEITDLDKLQAALEGSEDGCTGIADLQTVWRYLDDFPTKNTFRFANTLARGLNYYTGCIFEVRSNQARIGSLLGGGRYDDLTGIFGLKDVSGVGISFGVDRIFDIMTSQQLFPEDSARTVSLMVLALDSVSHRAAFALTMNLRNRGIAADLYPDPTKVQKQLKYADKTQVPYVLLVGSQEVESGRYSLKDMTSGDQTQVTLEALIKQFAPET